MGFVKASTLIRHCLKKVVGNKTLQKGDGSGIKLTHELSP